MNAATLINQTSSEVEYYTDPIIISAARAYLNVIDLDPASSWQANNRVQASRFYGFHSDGAFDDGLNFSWNGRIWMNHPFGRREPACTTNCKRREQNPNHRCHSYDYHGNQAWIDKLFREIEDGNLKSGLCITYAATSEAWFQQLLACPICFLTPRTNYYLPDGTIKKGVTKGSAIACFGRELDLKKFVQLFRPFGQIKVNP